MKPVASLSISIIKNGKLLTLAEIERQAIYAALTVTAGNRIEAAKLLGISKSTLFRRLSEFNNIHSEK